MKLESLNQNIFYSIARTSFQTLSVYRLASFVSLISLVIFGCIRALIFVALYDNRSGIIDSYSLENAITHVWLSQSIVLSINLWLWWEISDTVRSGNITFHLLRPYNFLGYWFSHDLGRAAYSFLFHAFPCFLIGLVFFPVQLPPSWIYFLLFIFALFNATLLSFLIRYLYNLISFWIIEIRGIATTIFFLSSLFSGFEIPLVYFPDWFIFLSYILPFRGLIQTPVDAYLGNITVKEVCLSLSYQLIWILILFLGSLITFNRATQKISVQGG